MSPPPRGRYHVGMARTRSAFRLAGWLIAGALTSHAIGEEAEEARGLRINEDGAFEGYTLFGPLTSTAVYLVDRNGEVVHTWQASHPPGGGLYLLDNGNLLRCGRENDNPIFHGGGIGGYVQEIDWDGNVVWEYALANEKQTLHHDVERLPNGNVLMILWEHKSAREAGARGRVREAVDMKDGFWPDAVIEVEPTRPRGGKIVWEWHAWDHLIQDTDPKKPGYGSIPDHPELIDINGDHRDKPPLTAEQRRAQDELDRQMRELGYVGGGDSTTKDDGAEEDRKKRGDWLHTNAVAYHAGFDLIVLSSPHLCEIWVIDHSTTTEEARGHSGGRFGRGGDVLWRWGNPRNYGAGSDSDRRLFFQHDPQWIPGAHENELRLTVFNNGGGRHDGDYSSVEEIILPFDPEVGFVREEGGAYGPVEPAWIYSDREHFFSAFISGAQRLANGNTLICEGAKGRIFEVTADGRVVWDYLNPFGGKIVDPGPGGNAPKLALFRATRLAPDHPGLAGRKL